HKEYVLHVYKLENIDIGKICPKKYPDLTFGERWWNGISMDVRFLNENQVPYCKKCEKDTATYHELKQLGKDVKNFENRNSKGQHINCSRGCFWYNYYYARRKF